MSLILLKPIGGLAQRYGFRVLSPQALAAAAFIVYLLTAAPGVYGFDSAELATGAYTLGIVHPPGYPLYLLLGKLFTYLPFGDVAYRLNLMSAVFAALTVYLLHRIIGALTGNRLVAWAGAVFFACSNYFWQMAVVAEVYTLHTFLLAACLWALIVWDESGQKRFLAAFALIFGLSLSNHTTSLLFAPAFAWWVASSKRWRWNRSSIPLLAGMLGLFVLGLSPYLYLPLRALANPPLNYLDDYYQVDLTTPAGLFWMVSGRAYRFFAFAYSPAEVPAEVLRFLDYLWRNFFGVGVLLGLAGFAWLWKQRPRQTAALAILLAANTIFYINYRVLDKDTMFLPSYLVWAVLLAAGMMAAREWAQQRVTEGLLHPAARPVLAGALVLLSVLLLPLNWRWVDMSQASGPGKFAQAVLRTMEPNARVVAQWSPAVVLEYYQLVEGERPDLVIYNRSRAGVARFYHFWEAGLPPDKILKEIDEEEIRFIHREISQHSVYVIGYDPLFERDFEYLPELNIFKLAPKDAHTSQ